MSKLYITIFNKRTQVRKRVTSCTAAKKFIDDSGVPVHDFSIKLMGRTTISYNDLSEVSSKPVIANTSMQEDIQPKGFFKRIFTK